MKKHLAYSGANSTPLGTKNSIETRQVAAGHHDCTIVGGAVQAVSWQSSFPQETCQTVTFRLLPVAAKALTAKAELRLWLLRAALVQTV
jgi:hypothetical protein